MLHARVIFSLSLCLMMFAAAIAAQPSYTMTDLGAFRPVAVIDGPIAFGNLNGVPAVWEHGTLTDLQHLGHKG